jgi:hypothetical protein
MIARQCRVRLGAVAEVDFANILKWTTEKFGRDRPRSIAIPWCRPSASSRTAPICPDQKHATTSCSASARSMLPGTAGAGATSSYIAPSQVGSLKSAESCTIRWTCNVTCRFRWTKAAMIVRRSTHFGFPTVRAMTRPPICPRSPKPRRSRRIRRRMLGGVMPLRRRRRPSRERDRGRAFAKPRVHVASLLKLSPGFTVGEADAYYGMWCFPPSYREKMRDALRMAGLP